MFYIGNRRFILNILVVIATTISMQQLCMETSIHFDLDQEKNLKEIYACTDKLAHRIKEKANELKVTLSDYQTYNVTDYEIERSLRTLAGLDYNSFYLAKGEQTDSAAVMLPSNLPLYSLVVFGLIPSFACKQVYVRPNSILQKYNIVSRLYNLLNLETLFKKVSIINTNHAGFKSYIKNANLVVFTGNPNNADTLLKEMKEGSVLALNGSGHNPVVVTASANVDKAVKGVLLLKGFNGGQDCAGPDAILVHHDIAQEFIDKFQKRYSSLKTGQFNDPETIIGPIHRLSELQKFATVLFNNSLDILSGGTIDYKSNIVSPTIIVRGIKRSPNYKEMFGPITFIHPYEKDEDLKYYFQDPDGKYNANRMYVTVYGESKFISTRDDNIDPNVTGNIGIILHNQTIHDVEIGYKAYGGYSSGASGVIQKTAKGTRRKSMPILLPEVIYKYLLNGTKIPSKKEKKQIANASPSKLKDKQIDPIISEFQSLASEIFGENLVFGFVFGSAAKGCLKIRGHNINDLDTFVCLQEHDTAREKEYIRRIAEVHRKYDLQVDTQFPAEIMTLTTLENTITSLAKIAISVDKLITGNEFDQIFWIHALTDKKTGFIGNSKLMSQLIKKSWPYILGWRNQIIDQLKEKESLPTHLCKTFSGLPKKELIEKLSKHSPHLVIHLGLHYDS